MKANELRIGNSVYGVSDRVEKIKELRGAYAITDHFRDDLISSPFDTPYEHMEPIPLTEEILLKCGFSYYSLKQGQLYYHLDGWMLLYTYGQWHYSPSPSNTIGVKLEYLHQLQNLYFALTGQELEVNI